MGKQTLSNYVNNIWRYLKPPTSKWLTLMSFPSNSTFSECCILVVYSDPYPENNLSNPKLLSFAPSRRFSTMNPYIKNTLQTFRIGPQKRNAWSLNGMICHPTDLETNTSYFFCVASLPQKACASDFGGLEKSPRCCHVAAVAAIGVHSPEMWEKSGPFEGQSDGAAKRWGAEDLSKDVGQSNRTRILIFPVFPGVIIHDAAEEPWNDNHDGHHGTMIHHHHHHLAIEMQVFPAHYQNDDWHQVTLQPEEVPSAWPHRKQRSSLSFLDNDSCVTL